MNSKVALYIQWEDALTYVSMMALIFRVNLALDSPSRTRLYRSWTFLSDLPNSSSRRHLVENMRNITVCIVRSTKLVLPATPGGKHRKQTWLRIVLAGTEESNNSDTETNFKRVSASWIEDWSIDPNVSLKFKSTNFEMRWSLNVLLRAYSHQAKAEAKVKKKFKEKNDKHQRTFSPSLTV